MTELDDDLLELVTDFTRAGILKPKHIAKISARHTHAIKPASMVGSDIVALRRRLGVSQAVLAEQLNVRTAMVSRWETGKAKPSGPAMKLLALIAKKGIDAVSL
jgi:putative transcriptional regulator